MQACPANSTDFRVIQCAKYNDQIFRGKYYKWKPYMAANVSGRQINECALNCMAIGHQFYAEMSAKVIDGTRCSAHSLDVCIGGTCHPVGCDGQLESTAKEDKCGVCNGNNTDCRTFNGTLDSSEYPLGTDSYIRVVEIPTGATQIRVNERFASRNYLALRSATDPDQYFLNGAWTIDWPRHFEIANTMFAYERPVDGGPERLSAAGPTSMNLVVMLLLQDKRVVVDYEYSVPLRPAKSPQHVIVDIGANVSMETGTRIQRLANMSGERNVVGVNKRRGNSTSFGVNHSNMADAYEWKYSTWSRCSVTCGRGVSRIAPVCVSKRNGTTVAEINCSDLPLLLNQTKLCNEHQCPAGWRVGAWSRCLKRCTSSSHRKRNVACVRRFDVELDAIDVVVNDADCSPSPRPKTMTKCTRDEDKCLSSIIVRWSTEAWTECWPPCDKNSSRSRHVYCTAANGSWISDERCSGLRRPVQREMCPGLPACPPPVWVTGPWAQCSVTCGAGQQMRSVRCRTNYGDSSDEQCELAIKPQGVQSCEVDCLYIDRSISNLHAYAKKGCVDINKIHYCELVVKFSFCNRPSFKQLCCKTCRHHT